MVEHKNRGFPFFKTLKIILLLLLLGSGLTYCTVENGFVLPPAQKGSVFIHPGPYQGVGAYIINLDRSPERYAYVSPQVDKLGVPVQRIPAVEGKSLPQNYIDKHVDLRAFQRFYEIPTPGAIGCALSHIKTWQSFLASNFQYALVFEDDVSFDPVSLRSVVRQLEACPLYWDITTFEIDHGGTPLPIKPLPDSRKLVVYLTKISKTGAYILNRKAATRLLEKALPLQMPIDLYFNRGWEFDLIFAGIKPHLVQQTYGDSMIGQRLHRDSGIKRALIRCRHTQAENVMRFLYNLKCYLMSWFKND